MGRFAPRRLKVEDLEEQLLAPGGGAFVIPRKAFDEVYPRVLVGGRELAEDVAGLASLGVTHVLNAAKGSLHGQVDLSHGYYRPAGIDFYGVPASDSPTYNIRPFFREAACFIEKALYGGGKVYVHCECGISRAPTIVLAFLLLRRGLSLRQALAVVRSKRSIFPNKGFLEQLIELDYDNQEKGLVKPSGEPTEEMALVESYPLEYYHYPSMYPRVTTRFLGRGAHTREYSPPPMSRDEIRREIRSRSVERDLPLVRYRASSLPPISRSSTPVREVTRYTSSPIHVYGTRTPHTSHSFIDQQIMYRPSTVTYTPRAVRGFDFEEGPVPWSTYGLKSLYQNLPSAHYQTPATTRIRYTLEPRFTSPTSNSIVPTSRFGSSTLALPGSRYHSSPARVYVAYPKRYPYTSSRTYNYTTEPLVHRSQHTNYKVDDGFPTRYSTYKIVYPSIYSYKYKF